MKNIDFLPEVYAQRRVQRRARTWWCLAAAALSAVVLLAASAQWMIRHGIERELTLIEPNYAAALQRHSQLEELSRELQREEEIATLQAYLSHPWPRSQLLAVVIRQFPSSMRLTEITIAYETLPVSPPLTPTALATSSNEGSPSPGSADLALLRSECDGRQAIVTIAGVATELSELHDYVDQLGKSPLIAAAHVKGVETTAGVNASGESRFQIHVAVRPGYGQDGGPELDAVDARSANGRLGRDQDVSLRTARAAFAGGAP